MTLLIEPDWPRNDAITAGCTTRQFISGRDFNLALHVNDDPVKVNQNRRGLLEYLGLELEPSWLNQVHGSTVVCAHDVKQDNTADASYSCQAAYSCVVLTADCLPVLFRNKQASWVAAAHAGWRGMHAGILEATVAEYKANPGDLEAWLGPAIGPKAYEIGEDVYNAFIDQDPAFRTSFTLSRSGHWYFDLYAAAKQILKRCGVDDIYGGRYCTYTEADRFYSYRRDGETGRMASLIGLKS